MSHCKGWTLTAMSCRRNRLASVRSLVLNSGDATTAAPPETLLRSQARLGAWLPGCVVRLRRHNRLELVGDLGGRREPAEDLCRNGIRVSQQRK